MSITKDLRKVFDACTVMAGVEPDFECVYMTKGAALLYLDEIDSENERLREEIEAAKHDLQVFSRGSVQLEAENAKLRELVRDMWEGYNDPRCEECHLKDTPTCADCPICAREASVIDRMRELGVEVDE